jgi:hypothetical protein
MIPPDRAAAVEISPELHRTEQRRRRWSESPMTRDDVVLAFRTSLADGGWPVEWADEVADENLEIAAELPAGTIIVRKLESYFLRGALLSYPARSPEQR